MKSGKPPSHAHSIVRVYKDQPLPWQPASFGCHWCRYPCFSKVRCRDVEMAYSCSCAVVMLQDVLLANTSEDFRIFTYTYIEEGNKNKNTIILLSRNVHLWVWLFIGSRKINMIIHLGINQQAIHGTIRIWDKWINNLLPKHLIKKSLHSSKTFVDIIWRGIRIYFLLSMQIHYCFPWWELHT